MFEVPGIRLQSITLNRRKHFPWETLHGELMSKNIKQTLTAWAEELLVV